MRPRKLPLLSWPKLMKTDIHPEYVLATVRCSCGNEFVTRSTKPELHVEICSACHPVLHGQAEARRHRRSRRALPAPARARRQAALGSSADERRRASRPRGRHDAQPVQLGGRRAKARRRDRAGLPADHLADVKRRIFRLPVIRGDHRARRVVGDRLPRPRDLGPVRGAGGRASTARSNRAHARAAHLRVRDLDRVRRDAVQGRPGADHEPHRLQIDWRVRRRRGR